MSSDSAPGWRERIGLPHLKTRAERGEEVDWSVNVRRQGSHNLFLSLVLKPYPDPDPLTLCPEDGREPEIRFQRRSPRVPQKLIFVHGL